MNQIWFKIYAVGVNNGAVGTTLLLKWLGVSIVEVPWHPSFENIVTVDPILLTNVFADPACETLILVKCMQIVSRLFDTFYHLLFLALHYLYSVAAEKE